MRVSQTTRSSQTPSLVVSCWWGDGEAREFRRAGHEEHPLLVVVGYGQMIEPEEVAGFVNCRSVSRVERIGADEDGGRSYRFEVFKIKERVAAEDHAAFENLRK